MDADLKMYNDALIKALTEDNDRLRAALAAAQAIPVNLPFERLPQHASDPGYGPVPSPDNMARIGQIAANAPTDAQIQAALKAWFDADVVTPPPQRMRKALAAAQAAGAYRKVGIDPLNPNPDGSDFHLMNAIDAAAQAAGAKDYQRGFDQGGAIAADAWEKKGFAAGIEAAKKATRVWHTSAAGGVETLLASLSAISPPASAPAHAAGAEDRRATFVAGFIDFRDKALMKLKDLKEPLLSKGAIAYVCDVLRALSPPASAETEKELPGGRPPWTAALPTPPPGADGRNPGSNNERIIARIKGVPAQSDPVIDPREPNVRPGWDTSAASAPAGAPSEEDVGRVIMDRHNDICAEEHEWMMTEAMSRELARAVIRYMALLRRS